MEEVEYLKCPCKECGNNIEYPVSSARTTIVCPHCGQWTELSADDSEKEEEPGFRIGLAPLIGAVVLLLVIGGGGIWVWAHKSTAKQVAAVPAAPPKLINPKLEKLAPSPEPTPATPEVNASNETVVADEAPKKPTRPKSPDDLKVGEIELQKTKGSSLVYAVGTLKNDSDYERYGVRVEVDLFNANGKKIGTAKDYKDYIAARQNWEFRALIPEPKAAKAQLASVKEDQ